MEEYLKSARESTEVRTERRSLYMPQKIPSPEDKKEGDEAGPRPPPLPPRYVQSGLTIVVTTPTPGDSFLVKK